MTSRDVSVTIDTQHGRIPMRLRLRSFGLGLSLSVAAFAGFAALPARAARFAASIESDPDPPPAALPDDMQPLPGASLKFLSIKAIDGYRIDAALWQPDNK